MHERDAAPMLERGVASSIIDLFLVLVRDDHRHLAAGAQHFRGTSASQERSGRMARALWIAVYKAGNAISEPVANGSGLSGMQPAAHGR